MPSRHEVPSLYELSEKEFAEYFARSWEEYWIDGRGDGRFLALVPEIPRTIANTIIIKILKSYIDRRIRGYHRICDLLAVFYSANLTILDLSDLVGIGARNDNQLKKFEVTLNLWLPKLTQVTKINLRTHTLQTTLPICTDNLLQGIGHHIKGLRVLDISKNNLVTDYGLEFLLPSFRGLNGCPLLEELFVFDCSVTTEGMIAVVENLKYLRILGYKETGEVLKLIHSKLLEQNRRDVRPVFNLTHINNLGAYGLVNHLALDHKFVDATISLCPKLMNLKVRAKDSSVPLLQNFKELRVLEVIYFEINPFLGVGTTEFLKVSGHQLYSLTILCPTFHSSYFVTLGEFCPNLHKLWFTCYFMVWDDSVENVQHSQAFIVLETLYFRIGFSETDKCNLKLSSFQYILRNTKQLSDFRLICNSLTLTDAWLRSLWKSFITDKIEYVLIALPFLNVEKKSLPLTMLSVNLILEQSSCIRHLGNLLVWDVTFQEVKNLSTYLNMCNYNVNLAYRHMKIK